MANWRGHTVGGALLGVAYVGVLAAGPNSLTEHTRGLLSDWQLLIGLMVICVLFALWPDIDTNSKGQNIFFGIAFVADILLIVNGRLEAAAYLGLIAMTPIIGKHRGWTHTKLAMILVPLPIVVIPYLYRPEVLQPAALLYGAAVVGYFSHLLLDGLIFKHFRIKTSDRS
ncbi:metal-dependent hydrolase [Candidatus Saccharibacteria bacterium]|nr:metal-dependent hydrolase [Candidatus Saccharibacteria bacterium]